MTIIERMARANFAGLVAIEDNDGITLSDDALRGIRAALRAVRPEDISDAMCAAAVASLRADGFNRPMNEHKVRRAIAAAIAAGVEE